MHSLGARMRANARLLDLLSPRDVRAGDVRALAADMRAWAAEAEQLQEAQAWIDAAAQAEPTKKERTA